MSQPSRQVASPFHVLVFAAAVMFIVISGGTQDTAHAGEEAKPRATPPGVWVQPRPPRAESDDDEQVRPSPRDRRDGERPGCPTNTKPLELLV